VGRNTRENTSHTYIYHTGIAGSRFRIANRDAGGRKMSSDTGTKLFSFDLSVFPADSLRTRGFGLSAEEAPQRRRRRRARIWSRRAGEVLTFHDGARPPRPPRIPLFAEHGTDARRRRTTTDTPNSKVAAVLRASATRTRALVEPRLARIRTYASHPRVGRLETRALPILPLGRINFALIFLRNGAYHSDDHSDQTSSNRRKG